VNYNLSPEERFKQKNIICFGVVPGLKKPTDFNHFLYPLVHQFQQVYTGVNAIDGSRQPENQHFLLRAFIVGIGADMPAKDMLMGLSGHSSHHYCNYCEARGIYSSRFRHMYAPVMPPNPCDPNWCRYDPNGLPIRNHHKCHEPGVTGSLAPVPVPLSPLLPCGSSSFPLPQPRSSTALRCLD